MGDELTFLVKWKTTSILHEKGERPQFSKKMEDDLNLQLNGRKYLTLANTSLI